MTKEIENIICELRLRDIGIKSIAKQLKVSRDAVSRVCRKHNLAGYRARQLNTEQGIKEKVENMIPDFTYIGGWESVDKSIYLQCRWCGYMFKTSAQFLKQGHAHNVKCHECRKIYNKVIEKQKELERETQMEIERQEREQIFWSQDFQQISMIKCKMCRSLFIPNGNRKVFCSVKCFRKYQSRSNCKYRLIVPLKELYRRDKGVCYLCGKVCDWNDYKINDKGFVAFGKNYPSRDHVFPKSKGGEHTWLNMRLAHLGCNARKGARTDNFISPPKNF